MYEDGYLADLTPFVEGEFPADAWASDVREYWSADGDLYALPMMSISQGVYYNAAILADALPAALRQPGSPDNWSWEQLLSAARILADRGYIPFANFTNDWHIEVVMYQSIAPNFGGDARRLDPTLCFNHQGMVDSLGAFAQLAPFLASDHATISPAEAERRFLDGEAAMLWGGSWELGHYERASANSPELSLGIILPPAPASRPQTVILHPDFGIGVNKSAWDDPQRRPAIEAFLRWIGEPQTGEMMAAATPGFYPLRSGVDIDAISAGLTVHDPFLDILKAGTGVRRWDLPDTGIPSGRLLLRRALRRLAATPPSGQPRPDLDLQSEADQIQRGLVSWNIDAQISNCLPPWGQR